ncbi:MULTISPECIES: class I SAM-dependent methyltransferase [Methylobacterium]|uniref:2-polyprenyl-3-methyl-5-hydroxy-6-metoxy-1,4-benzoquinol methylase n=2 Tax=Methylobacterium TaxID=407 RepID=A0A0C6FIF6_9HYPH|nr:class I SAM-dependent methyltransferase [Methylobacterium aquaticum]BAQ48283.1 2-polyprenyl-3-methyl-5-hydroxy-6-metoxy-1,4-benzoquinol methylase [Methylobacterium aquaticum]
MMDDLYPSPDGLTASPMFERDGTPAPGEARDDGPLFVARVGCPVCGADRPATLYDATYDSPAVLRHVDSHYRRQGKVDHSLLRGVDFTIFECRDCALIYQKMVPAPAMLHHLYDRFIDPEKLKDHEHARLTLDNHLDVATRLASLLVRIGKEPKDTTLLDFGFGYGRWARVAVGMGMQVFATEISPEKIAFARSIGVRIVDEAALARMQFDIVHTEQVFEHLTHPVEVFDMLARCIGPGGVLKLAVPRQGRIRRLLRKNGFIDWSPYEKDFKCGAYNDYNAVLPLEHLNAFCRKTVESLARRHDLVVETGRYGGSAVFLDASSRGRLLASARHSARRLLKDLYVRFGPGRADTGCYVLARRA